MKKLILFLLSFILVAFTASDCSYYFNMNVGDEIELQTFDEKNKLTGTNKQTVTAKTNDKITFRSVSLDKKGKEIGNALYDVICENGVLKIDMKSMLNAEVMKAYDPSTISIDATHLEMPSNLTVGQALPDGHITVKTTGDMAMLVSEIKVFNRKVLAKEDVTTPAGTFECYKLSSDLNSKIAFIKTSGSAMEWYSPEKGIVKSESYNKKGELTGYTVRSK